MQPVVSNVGTTHQPPLLPRTMLTTGIQLIPATPRNSLETKLMFSPARPQRMLARCRDWCRALLQANTPGLAPAIQSKPHVQPAHPYGSIQSPLSLGQTPYSPAMQGLSYPGSVSSCPSVSSSSGCSSASENQDTAVSKGYILSEYHVGPHRLINEKEIDNQSEEATTSGRNTPIDPTAEDTGNCVLPSKGLV